MTQLTKTRIVSHETIIELHARYFFKPVDDMLNFKHYDYCRAY